MSNVSIADYALLSDCHSAALVSRMGAVDWLCFPRFDAPSVFGRLLDERAGHWCIRPVGEADSRRRYVENTLVLETTFTTANGVAVLIDAMATGQNDRGHQLGAESPHALLRSVRCAEGEVELEMEFAPRFEYGLVYPLLAEVESGIRARGGASYMLLSSPVPIALEESTGQARFRLKAGERLLSVCSIVPPGSSPAKLGISKQSVAASRTRSRLGEAGRSCTRIMKGLGRNSFCRAVAYCKA